MGVVDSHRYSGWAFVGLLTDGEGGGKCPLSPLKSDHISCDDETCHSFTLPNEEPKN